MANSRYDDPRAGVPDARCPARGESQITRGVAPVSDMNLRAGVAARTPKA